MKNLKRHSKKVANIINTPKSSIIKEFCETNNITYTDLKLNKVVIYEDTTGSIDEKELEKFLKALEAERTKL